MTTVTRGATVLTPLLVTGFESVQESGNLIHPILGTSAPSVSYAPSTLRTGTFEFLVATAAIAESWRSLHLTSGIFVFYDADNALTINYVPNGDVTVTLDDESRTLWLVKVDWQEVIP